MKRAAVALALLLIAAACTDSGPESDDAAEAQRASPSPYAFPTPQGYVEPAKGWLEAACTVEPRYVKRIQRDYNPERSAELVVVPREPNYFGGSESTSHSGPWDYIQRVPMVFYGPGHIEANGPIELEREPTVADIAPTLADVMATDFPTDRPGRSITEAVTKPADPPKLVVLIVWDGGGTDVLQSWPKNWPVLKMIMKEGTSVEGTTVGSSPSVTPAIHANIGTGAFPKQHGIVDIPVRDGGKVVNSFVNKSPKYLAIPTLGDLYDQSTNNEAEIGMLGYWGWHLGMMGHGTYMSGGDADIVAIIPNAGNKIKGAPPFYDFPEYINDVPGLAKDVRTLDLEDGKRDEAWLGHQVLGDRYDVRHKTPAFILYQTRLAKAMLSKEDFGADAVTDMFFVNYKPIDSIGHNFNMLEPEVGSALKHADNQLKVLIEYLNEEVGQGEWVIALTADHGQTPTAASTGAWAIRQNETAEDIAEAFDVKYNDLIEERRPGHFWLNYKTMRENGFKTQDIADFLLEYTIADNASSGVPEEYSDRKDEPVIQAAWPMAKTHKVWDCVNES